MIASCSVPMGLLPDQQNCRLRMRGECREHFARHRIQRKPVVSDPGMHHGTCLTHVPWCMSESLTRGGGENVPGIPGTCATRNNRYLVRGPCWTSCICLIAVMILMSRWTPDSSDKTSHVWFIPHPPICSWVCALVMRSKCLTIQMIFWWCITTIKSYTANDIHQLCNLYHYIHTYVNANQISMVSCKWNIRIYWFCWKWNIIT